MSATTLRPARWRLPVVALLAVLFFLVQIQTGMPAAGEHLDISWLMVMGWGWLTDARIGHELVFTYGPWAIVHPWMVYQEDLFRPFLMAMLVFAALATTVLAQAAWRLPGHALALLVLAVLGLAPVLQGDGAWFLVLGLVPSLLADRIRVPAAQGATLWLLPAAVLCAWLALVKFSFLPAAALLWLVGAIALLRTERRRDALAWALAIPLALLVLWLLAGQPLAGLAGYVGNGWDVAVNYGVTMGLGMGWAADASGFALLCAIGLVLCVLLWQQRGQLAGALLTLACGGLVFLAWRAGYTRAEGHIAFFAAAVAGAALYLSTLLAPARRLPIAVAGLVLAALCGYMANTPITPAQTFDDLTGRLRQNLGDLADPAAARRRQQRHLTMHLETQDLPRSRGLLGEARVDVHGWQQGLALTAGLNYHPRPVFQSYSAYSDTLARLNEAHLLDPARAPEAILLKLQPIDGRLASSEDPLALAATLRAYQPVDRESGFLVMGRHAPAIPAQPAPSPENWRPLAVGEWIEVPRLAAGPTLAHIEVRPSLTGRLFGLLLREPPLLLEMDIGDAVLTRRLPRSALPAGFVVTPLLENTERLVDLYAGLPGVRVERIRLIGEDGPRARHFAADARIAFTGIDLGDPGQAERQQAMRALLYPGFAAAPRRLVAGERAFIEVRGRPALFLHAPARVELAVPAGALRATLEAGILVAAVEEPACAGADGIQVRVVDGRLGSELAVQAINPFTDGASHAAARLALDWQQSTPGTIWIELHPGANAHCDWSWLRDLEVGAQPNLVPVEADATPDDPVQDDGQP
ncbi:MAG: hypothetical protein KF823_03745 [Xanthomonadales bacterium]|nr:hypothetical protein [Xanthomonadales bacterium]